MYSKFCRSEFSRARRTAFETVRPYLDVMGSTIVHQGPAGSGQHTKLVNQILVAGNIVAVCEALFPVRIDQSIGAAP